MLSKLAGDWCLIVIRRRARMPALRPLTRQYRQMHNTVRETSLQHERWFGCAGFDANKSRRMVTSPAQAIQTRIVVNAASTGLGLLQTGSE